MTVSRRYMAAPVPRHIRQSKLGYLPVHCILGSLMSQGDHGANLYFDVVMLPEPEFQRMRTNVGLQHVATPSLQAGPGMQGSFLLKNVRHVVVPPDEPDPVNYARNYFIIEFGLVGAKPPA